MKTLSQFQINLIRGDLRREGVEMLELEDDLLDHICCSLEYEMENYESFEEAYQHIKREFCPNGYREIQEETTQLLTIKFNKMKKITNVIGLIGGIMLLIGTGFKFAHWPFANILTVSSVALLAFAYLPMMLILSLRQTDRPLSKVRNFIGYFSATILMVGYHFKFMHWPGATVLSLSGVVLFAIGFMPLFLYTNGKGAMMKISPIPSTVLVIVAACSMFYFIMPRSSSSFHRSVQAVTANVENSYADHQARVVSFRENLTESAPEKAVQAKALSTQADEITTYVAELKSSLLEKMEVDPAATGNQLPEKLMFEYRVKITNPVFESGSQGNKFNGKDLQAKVQNFARLLKEESGINVSPGSILDTAQESAEMGDWMHRYFVDQPVFAIFSNLSLLQLEVANHELEFIAAS